jgi:hypothetical protein
MPSPTYTLFRNAILAEQQVVCIYDGRSRELCPHIIGTNKDGEEAVLAWQFAGESSGKLPQWRCLRSPMSVMPAPETAVGMRVVLTRQRRSA